jgi:hypothetical protein
MNKYAVYVREGGGMGVKASGELESLALKTMINNMAASA